MTQADTVDALVLGGGIVGLLAARELVEAGLTVRLVDKDFSGPIRTHVGEMAPIGGDALLDSLYDYSLRCWQDVGKRYGVDVGLAERGLLDIASSAGRATMLAAEVQGESPRKIISQWVDAAGAATHADTPLAESVRGGKWWADAPVLSTHTALETLRRELTTKGVRIWGQDSVVELLSEGDTFTGVRVASGETCLAAHTLITVGTLAGSMLKTVGPRLPIRPARTHLVTLESAEGIGFPMLMHRLRRGHLWLKRTREGPVMLAYDGIMDPTQATFSGHADERIVKALAQHVGELLPHLANATVQQVSVSTAAVTPDFRPALGTWEGMKGLYIATGFGARSYAFAAGAARVLADLVQGKQPAVNMQPFRPDRFATGNWHKVGHPPSLAWKEPLLSSATQLVEQPEASYADNVNLIEKPEAKYASNVQQIEKKIIQAGSSKPAAPPVNNNVFGNSRVKAASIKQGD
ncbi:MAG: FAD-binding oxidoreductase [Pseudomonadaceae bacterium]|nr:FAD-binding oxidoreductase [Pseudomonadaceae bacterium]